MYNYDQMKLKQQIVVTGSSGFIGRNLTELLIQKGYEVFRLDRAFFLQFSNNTEASNQQLADWSGVKKKPYALIHLAAESIPSFVTENTKDININLTKIILNYFEPERFIFASSALVYKSSDQRLTEASATVPQTLYGKSKLSCEKLILDRLEGKAIVLRIFNAIGPNMNERLFVPSLIRKIKEAESRKENTIYMDGEDGIRSFLYIDDLVNAILLTMNCNIVPSILNICSSSSIRLSDFAARLSQRMHQNNQFIFKPSPLLSESIFIGSNKLSRQYLGDYNMIDIDECIHRLIGENQCPL